MRNARVPLFGNPLKSVTVNPAATDGATVGKNLIGPDGKLVSAATWQRLLSGGTGGNQAAIGTTDDLEEGRWNLYFTDRRAQDAVGKILKGSDNVTLTYTPGSKIVADLTDITDSGVGALLAVTVDAKGRVTGTRDATITGTAGRVTVAHGDASDGLPTIDLAEVTDAGGGALLKISRDAWGRIVGTSQPDTGDLPEGSNLYYTDARAQAAVVASAITDGDTTHAPSGDAVHDALALKANDDAVMHIAGAETATGLKTFLASLTVQRSVGSPQSSALLVDRFGTTFAGRSDPVNAKPFTFNASTDSSDSPPTSGSCFIRFSTLGVARWDITDSRLQPSSDNVYSLGGPSNRASVVYAATGAINTSDSREKTEVAPLAAAELAAATDLSRAIGTYQWLAMIAEKGADGARHHAGLTVQRAIEIMQAHGLDPFRYGFICYDEWGAAPAVIDDETGDEIEPPRAAGDRYSFRHDELLLFLARGFAARLDALEAP